MADSKDGKKEGITVVAVNRRARHEYFINEVVEAGIILTGTEVKSLREGQANIAESYASPEDGAIWLINANIPEYFAGNRENHAPQAQAQIAAAQKRDHAPRASGRTQGFYADAAKTLF